MPLSGIGLRQAVRHFSLPALGFQRRPPASRQIRIHGAFFQTPERAGPMRQASRPMRSEEHTSELQSLMRNSYAVFCLKKKKHFIPLITQQTKPNLNTQNKLSINRA